MTDPQVGMLMLGLFIFIIMLGFPIAFTLMAMGVAFGYYAYYTPGQEIFENRIASRPDAIKVPRAALRFVPSAAGDEKALAIAQPPGKDTVWRLGSGSEPEAIPIKTGISDGVFTEVVEGALQPGDEIIVGVVDAGKNKSGGPLRF